MTMLPYCSCAARVTAAKMRHKRLSARDMALRCRDVAMPRAALLRLSYSKDSDMLATAYMSDALLYSAIYPAADV